VEQVLDGQLPEFPIGHQFSENLLIALHAVDHEALEGFLEDVAEVAVVKKNLLGEYVCNDSPCLRR
jgi:hypothetical protein